jgi:hypothetical protein
MLSADVKVRKEIADERDPARKKYTRVLTGITADFIEVELKLTADDESVLEQFSRRDEFFIQIHPGHQTKLPQRSENE